jgi:hypothetical protein
MAARPRIGLFLPLQNWGFNILQMQVRHSQYALAFASTIAELVY